MSVGVETPSARPHGRLSALDLAERSLVPDLLVRWGIRRLLRARLAEVRAAGRAGDQAFREEMRRSPIAVHTDAANAQHYELPPAFFEAVLGPHLKYSSALWKRGTGSLAEAEQAMLELTAQRAELRDGDEILELGCGWGSLSLHMASTLPGSRITAVSNSASQRRFILERARQRGLSNLDVITADMNVFDARRRFDRVVSVEMFEHMRNWERLIGRVSEWLRPGGTLFVHVFSHRDHCYAFEPRTERDWMAQHFFTGGMMPSHRLPAQLDLPLELQQSFVVEGTHYARTADAWLENLDARRDELRPLFEQTYGRQDAERWIERWRMFFLSCSELFAYRGGREWHVSHHLLRKPGSGERRN